MNQGWTEMEKGEGMDDADDRCFLGVAGAPLAVNWQRSVNTARYPYLNVIRRGCRQIRGDATHSVTRGKEAIASGLH